MKILWKSVRICLTYEFLKSRLVFWDRDNHSVALDSGYCRPSGDVISSYSDDLMSRSPSMKVMDKVKGHRSRSYRQFQGHWPRRFRLIMLLAITYVRLWRHRVNHPILISRSKVKVKGHGSRSNLISRQMGITVLVVLWLVRNVPFCDVIGQWPWMTLTYKLLMTLLNTFPSWF